jgi:hypothetical protein
MVQGVTVGTAAAAGALAFRVATTDTPSGRLMDDAARYARMLGNYTPFQIGNTFRIPEFLSPFTSSQYQELAGNELRIDKRFFGSRETQAYIERLSGKSGSELQAMGLGRGGDAQELVYRKTGRFTGTLHSVMPDRAEHLIASNLPLMQMSPETPNLTNMLGSDRPLNRAMGSVVNAMDLKGAGGFHGFEESRLWADGAERLRFAPIPGWGTYAHAIPTFTLTRFNDLVENIGKEVLGENYTTLMEKFGLKLSVAEGPASHMFLRTGLKGGLLLGGALAVNELDWLRRKGDLPAHVAVSAVMATGIGAIAAHSKLGPKAGFFVGLAAFAGQQILPGFDQGVMPGLASTVVGLNQLRSIPLNPFNYQRRTLEGFFPGITGAGTGVLVGAALAILPHVKFPSGKAFNQAVRLSDRMMNKGWNLGIDLKTPGGDDVRAPKTVGELHWEEMFKYGQRELPGSPEKHRLMARQNSLLGRSTQSMRIELMHRLSLHMGTLPPGSSNSIAAVSNTYWHVAEQSHRDLAKKNPVDEALLHRLQGIQNKYLNRSDTLSRVAFHAEGLLEQTRHAFFGATLHQPDTRAAMTRMGFKSPIGRVGLLFAAGFAAHQLFLGGALGSMDTYTELRERYSGRAPVFIGKGRGFELGGTPWGGSEKGMLRPHWYPIMMNRVRQAGIWGGDEDRYSPIAKFFMANFTHKLEEQTYYDRPYPISAPAFANLPVVGPLLGATVGRLFKPPRLMHTGEWARVNEDGDAEFASVYKGWKREPAYNLGANGPGIPISPYASKSVFAELSYQYNEMGGLVGFVNNTISKILTGESIPFSDRPRLADSGLMTSYRRAAWDLNIGGGGPIGEVVRRVLPSYPKDWQRVNPIPNKMPSWLPEALSYGDPYTRFPLGEAVLPGPGYARLYPELQGIDAEDYPLMHKYNILSQVSPLSNEFRETRDALYRMRAAGGLTPVQETWADRIDEAVTDRWNVRNFDRSHKNAITGPGTADVSRTWLGLQQAGRKIMAPLEYGLGPASPRLLQKFMANRNEVEQYEYERMYGTPMAFWDKPGRDWIRPTMYSLANHMGYQGKPLWRMEADRVNEYFDEAEFYKWMSLSNQAAEMGNVRDKIRYEYLASNTRMGISPQGNPLSIYWSLPEEERSFFNAFSMAEGKTRKRILNMIPENQTHLYKALWSRMDNADPTLWPAGRSGPDTEYLQQRYGQMDTSDLPEEDWIGYNKDVDLRDIKVRYVNELGREMRDFGLWEEELGKAYSQPILNDSTEFLHRELPVSRGRMIHNLSEMLFDGMQRPDLQLTTHNGIASRVQIDYDDNRQSEVYRMIREQIDGL